MSNFKRYHRSNGEWEKISGGPAKKGIEMKPRIMTLVPKSETTHEAVSDGEWDSSSTWENGNIPGEDARVRIPSGITVTLTHQDSNRFKTIRVEGTLKFDPSVDTKLNVDTIVTTPGSSFQIGTESNPVQQDVTAEIRFIDTGQVTRDSDPYLVGRGLITMGDLEIVGAQKSAWHSLTQNPTQGDQNFELSEAPTNWQEDDTIVTPDVEPYTEEDLIMENGEVLDIENNDEERTVSNINGSTVELTDALNHDHVPPKSDLDTYVLNLTRNVKFYSENSDLMHRGHFMVMEPESKIKYLQMKDMGRTDKSRDATTPIWYRGEPKPDSPPNPRARYSLHFHHTDPTNLPHKVEGCVVWDNPGWGYVNHDSHAEVEDCISYKVLGSGFNTEKGTEAGHFKNNFALRSIGSGEEVGHRKGWSNGSPTQEGPPHNIDDFAHSGHGFWIHSPVVEVENNVAAGHAAHGFIFFFRNLYEERLDMENGEKLDGKNDLVPQLPRELLTDEEQELGRPGDLDPVLGRFSWHEKDDSVFFGQSCRLRKFDNNTAFGSGAGCGFRSVSFRNRMRRPNWTNSKNFTAYNIGPHFLNDGSKQGQLINFESSGNVGMDHRYIGNLLHTNYRLIGTGGGIGSGVNLSYTNGYDLENCTIENFEYGFTPKTYNSKGLNFVKNCTFDNQTDILLRSRFYDNKGGLYLEGNNFNGDRRLEWRELHPANMSPRRFLNTAGATHSGVNFENRTVYHGWSHPDFVICDEGDTERLNNMLNHGHTSAWEDAVAPDDPHEVIPGTTHQEFYDQYGITFYGGIQDPSQEGFEQPSDFNQPNEHGYGRDPFLGPKPEDKTMPTDEIWVDVRKMDRRDNASLVDVNDHPELEGAFEQANGDTLVKIETNTHHSQDPSDDNNNGVVSYNFDIDTDGPYEIFLRCYISREGINDHYRQAYYRINGGSWKNSGNNLGQYGDEGLSAFWLKVSASTELDKSNNSQKIELAAMGNHIFADWLLINHKTVGTPPIGDGKPHTPSS